MGELNGGFGQPGAIGGLGMFGGQKGLAKGVAVSLQALAATPVIPATPISPVIAAIDPVLAAKMAQLQADFELKQIAMEQ